jgi:hypothetical protein
MSLPPFPEPPQSDTAIWVDLRGEYETDSRLNVKALARKYGVREAEINSRVATERWSRPGDGGDEEDLPPEAVKLRNQLIQQIATKGQVTIQEIPGILAFANVRALMGGKVKEIVEAATLAGKYKDLQAWKEAAGPNEDRDLKTATPDELQRMADRIAEMLNGAPTGTKHSLARLQEILASRAEGAASGLRPN